MKLMMILVPSECLHEVQELIEQHEKEAKCSSGIRAFAVPAEAVL
jgi:hypothetical protein